MHKVIWDIETGGVLLSREVPADAETVNPPRPVFFEELDLLGFERYWNYPKAEEPLLWAIDRRYYYRGHCVAEARGGHIFEAPEIVLTDDGRDLILEPVNIPLMLERNQDSLATLENEAIDFVEYTYKKYRKKKNIHFVASFSGGKDSQVVLDIISRVIPPDNYIVIFTDTTMEIPPTYQAVKDAEKLYTERYPGLKFYKARNPQHSHDLWREFGPPSRILRWCCSVYKTAPVIKLIRSLYPLEKQPKLIIFEGVRSDESSTRGSYKRLSSSTKHLSQKNAEVIKEWNTAEVFLYLFHRDIELNVGYRYGLNRVGCNICPFSSNWSEFIICKIFPELAKEYVDIIKQYVIALGVKDDISTYISERQWKKRAGGRGLSINSRVDFINDKPDLEANLVNYREDFWEWIKTIGDVIPKSSGDDRILGEIQVGEKIFNFDVENKKEQRQLLVTFKEVWRDPLFLSKLRKVLYKTTYCSHCGACEIECPTRALTVFPKVQLDNTLCIHCGRCLDFAEKGCLMAKSVAISAGEGKMGKSVSGFSRYETFGMKEEWLRAFFSKLEEWFSDNQLGPGQIRGMVAWLRDAELLESKGRTATNTCKILQKLFLKDESFVWQILWINLSYNSNLIKWYVSSVPWGNKYAVSELKNLVQNDYPDAPKRTIANGIKSLVQTFETSPFGKKLKLGAVSEGKGNDRLVEKKGTDDIHPLAVAYLLYKYAADKKSVAFTVSEFYKEEQIQGPYSLFGLSKEKFEKTLRWLQENKHDIVRVDLTADLDNVHLREGLTYEQILTMVD